MHIARCLILALAGLCASSASAHYREPCWAKFSVHPGVKFGAHQRVWSQVFAVQCNYLTGRELNGRGGTQRFAADRVYVVIVWPKSAPSIIRVSEPLLCGFATEVGCAERISGRLYGRDHFYRRGSVYRRSWEICQPGFMGRDCYRMLGAH